MRGGWGAESGGELGGKRGRGTWVADEGGSSHANTNLLSDIVDTWSTSATWSYRQHDLEEKGDLMNQSVNDEAVCRTTPVTPGLLFILYAPITRGNNLYFLITRDSSMYFFIKLINVS